MRIVEHTPIKNLHSYILELYAAAQRSKVTRKKMGAIIIGRVNGNVWQILADGCNGVASGADHEFERDGLTLSSVIHAERNAIEKLERVADIDTNKHYKEIVLIVMSSPCIFCAKEIVDSRLFSRVLYLELYRDPRGTKVLEDAGIHHELVDSEHTYHAIQLSKVIAFEASVSIVQQNIIKQLISITDLYEFDNRLFNTDSIVFDVDTGINLRGKKRSELMLDAYRALRYSLLSLEGHPQLLKKFEISSKNRSITDWSDIPRVPTDVGDILSETILHVGLGNITLYFGIDTLMEVAYTEQEQEQEILVPVKFSLSTFVRKNERT